MFDKLKFSVLNRNPYIHLTNNSIQKHSDNFKTSGIEGNMWHLSDFQN